MDSTASAGELTLNPESKSAELEPTAGGPQPKLSRREQKLAKLSMKQLKFRANAKIPAAFAAIIGPLPVACFGAPFISSVINPAVLAVLCIPAIVGGLFWALRSSESELELEKRAATEASRAHAEWEKKALDGLEERFAVRFTPDELFELEYPKENPPVGGMVNYGTIQKLVKDAEENISLEKITLIWDESEFKLLRSASNLRELNRGAMA